MTSDDIADVLSDVPLDDTTWAELLCVHPGQVSRWRRGKSVPRASSAALRILAAIHCLIMDGADTARLARRLRGRLTTDGWAAAVAVACARRALTAER